MIGQIELDPAGQETDNNFSGTAVTMDYKYPFTRDHSLGLTVNYGHLNNFDTDQFDIDNIRGELAYNWGNQTHRFKHGITSGKVNLDQNGFQKIFAVNSSCSEPAKMAGTNQHRWRIPKFVMTPTTMET